MKTTMLPIEFWYGDIVIVTMTKQNFKTTINESQAQHTTSNELYIVEQQTLSVFLYKFNWSSAGPRDIFVRLMKSLFSNIKRENSTWRNENEKVTRKYQTRAKNSTKTIAGSLNSFWTTQELHQ